ncbi:unnamed protein product, partial [Rotaria sp. Silwood1]
KLIQEIKHVQEELQKLREQEHQLIVERDKWQATLMEQEQILKEEQAKVNDLQQQIIVLENDKRLGEQEREELNGQ